MKTKIILLLSIFVFSLPALAQEYIPRLELDKREKKMFSSRDSVIHLKIDTLILKDRSSLQFLHKKKVILEVGYAEIGDKVKIFGSDGQNNGSDFDINIHLASLGDLYLDAGGLRATKGRQALPHGNGGTVNFVYNTKGMIPQTKEAKESNYLRVNVSGGDNLSDSRSEISIIQSQIGQNTGRPLGGLPQGKVYQGVAGENGKVTITGK